MSDEVKPLADITPSDPIAEASGQVKGVMDQLMQAMFLKGIMSGKHGQAAPKNDNPEQANRSDSRQETVSDSDNRRERSQSNSQQTAPRGGSPEAAILNMGRTAHDQIGGSSIDSALEENRIALNGINTADQSNSRPHSEAVRQSHMQSAIGRLSDHTTRMGEKSGQTLNSTFTNPRI